MLRWSFKNSEWNYLDKWLAVDPTFGQRNYERIKFLKKLQGNSEGKDVHSSAVNLSPAARTHSSKPGFKSYCCLLVVIDKLVGFSKMSFTYSVVIIIWTCRLLLPWMLDEEMLGAAMPVAVVIQNTDKHSLLVELTFWGRTWTKKVKKQGNFTLRKVTLGKVKGYIVMSDDEERDDFRSCGPEGFLWKDVIWEKNRKVRSQLGKNVQRILRGFLNTRTMRKKERKSWKKSERSILKKDQSGQSTLCGDVIGINAEGRHRLGKSRAKNQCKEQMKFYMLSLHV